MWIFLNNAALSIVAHRYRHNVLMVRARVAGDIETVFPGADVEVTPSADYRYRALVPVAQVSEAIAIQVGAIAYTNFKGSVQCPGRAHAYMGVWSAWDDMGRQLNGEEPDAWLPLDS